jgi:hypothetical protein
MEACFRTPLVVQDIDGVYSQLKESFEFYSAVLGCDIYIPEGFITDFESVPVLRTTSKRAGVIHDYLCRIDAYPSVPKQLAARVYHEAMACRDRLYYSQSPWYIRTKLFCYRWIKSSVVRVAWGYWKKHKVMASYAEIRA